jgi:hypothetical protein
MGLSRDFDRVTVEDDGKTVRVEATTSDGEGNLVAPDPATDMYITLVALPDRDVFATARPETMPIHDASWAVLFKDVDEKLLDVDNVMVFGVAITDGKAEAWTERRPLKFR